jgi:hypothetical protein
MPLSVIGAGLSRTGTMSLKLAIEQLGLGPCHHMTELFTHFHLVALWERALDGTLGDFEEIFKDYAATTDEPAAIMWETLANRYPAARVILTLRDPEKWWASMRATIYSQPPPSGTPNADAFTRMARKMAHYSLHDLGLPRPPLGTQVTRPSRETMLARFHAHNEKVRRSAAPGRLLVFEVAQGWEPLCGFLGKPTPATPFPRVNDATEWPTLRAWLSVGGNQARHQPN